MDYSLSYLCFTIRTNYFGFFNKTVYLFLRWEEILISYDIFKVQIKIWCWNLTKEGNYFQKSVRLEARFSNGLKRDYFENFLGKCVLWRNLLENIYCTSDIFLNIFIVTFSITTLHKYVLKFWFVLVSPPPSFIQKLSLFVCKDSNVHT